MDSENEGKYLVQGNELSSSEEKEEVEMISVNNNEGKYLVQGNELPSSEKKDEVETKVVVARGKYDGLKRKLVKHHLVMGLLFGVIFGWTVPPPGAAYGGIIAKNTYISMTNIHVFIIFLISGSGLKTDEVKKALSEWKAILYGVAAILFLTPLMGGPVRRIPLGVKELSYGLGIFCCMPTTLSSGVILISQTGGNTSLGLLLTVTTNLLGVLTMPFMLWLTFSSVDGEASVEIDPGTLLYKLTLFIALPLCMGKCIHHSHPKFPGFRTRHKLKFKLTSSLLLCMVPWMKVSQSVDKMNTISVGLIVVCIVLGALIHLVYLACNYVVARFLLKLEVPEQIALTILASQKTLGVTVTVVEFLSDSFGAKGVILVPCIFAHFIQILIDGFILSNGDRVFSNKGNIRDCFRRQKKPIVVEEEQ